MKKVKRLKQLWWFLTFMLTILPMTINTFVSRDEVKWFSTMLDISMTLWLAFLFPGVPGAPCKVRYGLSKICKKEWEQRVLKNDKKYFLKRYIIVWATMLFLFFVFCLYKYLRR